MHLTSDFLNMEFTFRYGIREFLKHNLTSETQLLAAIWHATVLIFDTCYIRLVKNQTQLKYFVIYLFLKGCVMLRFNAFSHST